MKHLRLITFFKLVSLWSVISSTSLADGIESFEELPPDIFSTQPTQNEVVVAQDAIVSINERLRKAEKVLIQKEKTEWKEKCTFNQGEAACSDIKVKKKYNAPVAATIAKIDTIQEFKPKLNYEEVFTDSNNISISVFSIHNCGKAQERRTIEFNRMKIHTYTTTLKKTVKLGYTHSFNFSVSLFDIFKAGADNKLNAEVTTESGKSNSFVTNNSQKYIVNTTVEPKTLKYISYVHIIGNKKVPFNGTFVIDGLLSPNLSNKKRLSDLLSNKERIFDISGFVSVGMVTKQDEIIKTVNIECKDDSYQMSNYGTVYLKNLDDLKTSNLPLIIQNELLPKITSKDTPSTNMLMFNDSESCYSGPCNTPLDGTREWCYLDENEACTICRNEQDPVCEPD